MQDLSNGTYGILCFVIAPDGAPHVAKGMLGGFTVEGAAPAPIPLVDLEVELKAFQFSVPDTLPAGTHRMRVDNVGEEPHEFGVVRLAEGTTIDDVRARFAGAPPSGPPPWTYAGGLGGSSPGFGGDLTLELTPGAYALICQMPSPEFGKSHAALGMIQALTVP